MKIARINATLPDLKGNCYADGKGEGSTPRAAISRAIDDLLKQPNVKGKRLSKINCIIFISTREEAVCPSESPKA